MALQVLIAGGGIGGLAAALACARAGHTATVHEQAAAFSEAGAGIQLGPNATRVLHSWGLAGVLDAVAARPDQLSIRRADSDGELASMPLRFVMEQRYGAPYVTVHRADLQVMLLGAAVGAGVDTRTASRVEEVSEANDGVRVRTASDAHAQADALVAADGIWSALRTRVAADAPRPTGHVAFRALARQSQLPPQCRTQDVTVWLGPRMHVVCYPVRRGDFLNMVVLAEAAPPADVKDWDAAATTAELQRAIGPVANGLRDRIEAMPAWRLWTLHDRAPLHRADQMARGRIALLGDAAHPMLPYLAQGAGMAIEDAGVLGRCLPASTPGTAVPSALQDYARLRWQRCARVQQVARRNALVFHAQGPLAWGRDASLRMLGERLLDQPWLYR